jgi:thioredoxin reductase
VKIEDVIIIGAGPGGLATALQLKRYGIDPLIFEHNQVGGLLHNANLVENYPGFPGGIPGPNLVRLFDEQIQDHSIRIHATSVKQLNHSDNNFKVSTPKQDYQARIMVIASGTKPRHFTDLYIPEDVQEKVYYEVYPLLDHKGQQIAIVGAGDAAFDYALNLGGKNEIMILNRSDQISCLPLLWERAQKNQKIKYLQNTRIAKVSKSSPDKIVLECTTSSGPTSFKVNYLIGAIGRDPQLDFVTGQFEKKAIQLEGLGVLYYVGDVVHGLYRQTAISVGNGILTAMKIYKHLEEKV